MCFDFLQDIPKKGACFCSAVLHYGGKMVQTDSGQRGSPDHSRTIIKWRDGLGQDADHAASKNIEFDFWIESGNHFR